jgi:hypothetical protein
MKTDLNFEQETTKKLLSKLDFEFFLKQNIEVEKYNQSDVDEIYTSYNSFKKELLARSKGNKKQFNYYTEGQVRKMFTGGLLPAMFELDEGRGHRLCDFPGIGENWAYFNHWQIYYKRKVTREKIWDFIIKTGSILAFVLSFSKIIELIIQYINKK